MKRISLTALRIAGSAGILWATAIVSRAADANRATVAMMLLLEVFAIATLGDWVVALLASTAASLAFSYYFIDTLWSFQITTAEGAISLTAMLLTALIGSLLAVRAQRRAQDAILRREEMNRVNQFGRALLAANSIPEAGEIAVRNVVELFRLRGAVLRLDSLLQEFQSGTLQPLPAYLIPVGADPHSTDVLELYGELPSAELGDALGGIIRLVLERVHSAEARAEIEAVQRGEELRSTVFNALAHNLRTPLTSIKAAASTLRGSDNSLSADERELIAVIDEEADRLDQLIRESLDLAKLEGRANPRAEVCRIYEIVDRVTARVARYLGRREFTIEIPDELPPIIGDSFLLEQMLVQVVDNAWKYSRPGARIEISAVVSEGNIILTVLNEGSEIPEDERTRIFDKFYRGNKDRLTIEGTGMGLAIAKTIAEACKGKLWLDVEAHGPAFRFALPLNGTGMLLDTEPHHIDH